MIKADFNCVVLVNVAVRVDHISSFYVPSFACILVDSFVTNIDKVERLNTITLFTIFKGIFEFTLQEANNNTSGK